MNAALLCATLMPAMEPDSPHLRGCLVVFEGIDGTGKSTQIKLLADYLRKQGKEVITDYEPTRGEWGMKVRNAALSGERLGLDEEINCLLLPTSVIHLITPFSEAEIMEVMHNSQRITEELEFSLAHAH